MASAVEELKNKLDGKHPDYQEWESEWQRYQDVIGQALVSKETYLPRNNYEPRKEYEFRLKLSQFIPESGLAIEKILGGLFREKPKREFPGQEAQIKEFLDDADRQGNSWNQVLEDVATTLMAYGVTRLLVNVPPAIRERGGEDGEEADRPVITRADEQLLGLRPYVINYSPLSVIDWSVDQEGTLEMIRIKETRYLPPEGGISGKQATHREAIRYIEYTQMAVRWWDFVKKDNDYILVDQDGQMHGLGLVPMVCESLRVVKPMIGHSFLRYSSRADVRKFQAESDEGYDTYTHAHPLLTVWTEEEMKEVGVGSSTWLKLHPGSGGVGREDAKYIGAPTSAFEALSQVIEKARVQIYRQANIDPMGVISGSQAQFQASGVSRAWSFGTSEARMLARLADKLTKVETRSFELVARWDEPRGSTTPPGKKVSKASVQYPEEFDLSSTQALIEETQSVGQMINSETLLRHLHKRIAASKVGDAPAKILKQIKDEIDNNPLIGTPVGRPTPSLEMPDLGSLLGGLAGAQKDEEQDESQPSGDKKNGPKPGAKAAERPVGRSATPARGPRK